LRASAPTAAQDWAHHAFSGGCFDLMRQGVHQDKNLPIHQYDISSAYPAQIAQLPSMLGGKYKFHKPDSLKDESLDVLKAFVEDSNMLSMFEIEWSNNV
jgi:hypothetical protein